MANRITFISMEKPPAYSSSSETCCKKEKEKEAWSSNASLHDIPEDEPFYNVQGITFPGLDKVVRSESTTTRKILWALVFVTCVGIICMQVTDRVRYYNMMPVNMNMRPVRNQTMMIPRITICHGDTNKQSVIKGMRGGLARSLNRTIKDVSLYDLLLVQENLTKLWETIAYQLEDMVLFCRIKGKDCNEFGSWKPIMSVGGICYTYVTNEMLASAGPSQAVRITLREKRDAAKVQTSDVTWRILIHSPKEDPRAEVMRRGISVTETSQSDIRLRLRRYEWVNSDKKPCAETTVVNCFFNCQVNTIYNGVGCRLPFMDNSSWPLCSTPSLYRTADSIRGNSSVFKSSDCACIPECKLETFEISVDNMQQLRGVNNSRVRIFYDDFVYDQYYENPAYSIVSMLCDIGGSLGLFLGASVLSFVELADILVATMQKRCRPTSKKGVKEDDQRASSEDVSRC